MNSAPTKVPVLKGLQNAMNDAWQKFFTSLVSAITTLENKTPLVYETTVSGGAVTSINITGLDINTDGIYEIELDYINAGTASDLYLYVNGDTTATNYYTAYSNIVGAAASDGEVNYPVCAYSHANDTSRANIFIYLTANGYFVARSEFEISVRRLVAGTKGHGKYTISKTTATLANITQLTLTTPVASQLANGTRVRVWKRGAI